MEAMQLNLNLRKQRTYLITFMGAMEKSLSNKTQM